MKNHHALSVCFLVNLINVFKSNRKREIETEILWSLSKVNEDLESIFFQREIRLTKNFIEDIF